MPDLTPNHPAVEAAHDVSMAWLADMRGDLPDDEMVCVLTAALPHLTADDLRDTPAGRALMAEVLEEEAYVMDVVISNGDAAEVAAPAPGETGRGSAVAARDALYENPAQYLRNRARIYLEADA